MLPNSDRNCISYWLPRLEAAGIPTPKTELLRTDVELIWLCDGKEPEGFKKFVGELGKACLRMAPTPRQLFLRTGMGSGKHNWRNCCCVEPHDDLARYVSALVNWSECVDFLGLPTNVWAVREMLPSCTVGVLNKYAGMPLAVEARCFVSNGEVCCKHNYWPLQAIAEGMSEDQFHDGSPTYRDMFDQLEDELKEGEACIQKLASDTAKVFAGDGAWSVDILKAHNGWFVTDMAEAYRSYHDESCEYFSKLRQSAKDFSDGKVD